jgi:large subunit ribosomal protein L13
LKLWRFSVDTASILAHKNAASARRLARIFDFFPSRNGTPVMKTYSAKASEIEKKWFLVDADGVVLGRLASQIALILRGKHKTTFTPHMDCGDNVIVVNAEKVRLTGNKRADKTYYRHTGYPGGVKQRIAGEVLEGAHPERVVIKAVERMISRNPLGRQQMKNLRVYAGEAHPHDAQQPEPLDIAGKNPKNKRSA